jgi:hypothetical protein
MALAARGVYDDLVYGITRPFVAFRVVTGLDVPALVSQDPTVVKVLHERVKASGKLWCIPSRAVRCLAHKVPVSLTQGEL